MWFLKLCVWNYVYECFPFLLLLSTYFYVVCFLNSLWHMCNALWLFLFTLTSQLENKQFLINKLPVYAEQNNEMWTFSQLLISPLAALILCILLLSESTCLSYWHFYNNNFSTEFFWANLALGASAGPESSYVKQQLWGFLLSSIFSCTTLCCIRLILFIVMNLVWGGKKLPFISKLNAASSVLLLFTDS